LYLTISLVAPELYLLPNHVLQSFSFGCVAVALALYPNVLLVNRLTCWIGKLSYSMYLTHFAVIGAASRLIHRYGGNVLPRDGDLLFIAGFISFTLVSAVVSTVSYQFVERPGIGLGKRSINHLDSSLARRLPAPATYELGSRSSEA